MSRIEGQSKLHDQSCSMKPIHNLIEAEEDEDTVTDYDTEDSDIIVKILSRRECAGKVKLEIKWSNGTREWALEKNVKADVPGLYNKFQEEKFQRLKL